MDTRIGRWLSVDPITDPVMSPYNSMDNNPILNSDPEGDCATCPKGAKFGARHSEIDAGGTTPQGGFVFAGEGSSLNYVNIGNEKNPSWVIGSFQNKSGDVFSWNNEKKWYEDGSGKEYDQPISHDITNFLFKSWGKPMSEAAKNAFEGEPFKDTRDAYSQYKARDGGGVPSFIWTGLKNSITEWGGDLMAGGNRSGQAFIGLWQFTASAGVPGENFPKLLTTSEGYLLGSVTFRLPFSMKVQRFGSMGLTNPDYWGPTLFGSSRWGARIFNAILPEWNNLSVYTTGVIPKGTKIRMGLTGPQGWLYPGGLFQFQIQSRRVVNQTSKLMTR